MSGTEQHLSAVIGIEEPRDTAARLAACDVEHSWIVEAPAGSGKTELLMQRFLRLLARVEQPEQVLAITFTRKAAAEMRDRILESLRNARQEIPTPAAHSLGTREFARQALENDARHGWNLLFQPQRLNIRTIDSLCSAITARLPVLSRLGAEMRPVEDASALYLQAARQTLEEVGSTEQQLRDAARSLLMHFDNKLEYAAETLAAMLKNRDQWRRALPIEVGPSSDELDRIIEDRFEKTLRQTIAEHLQAATGSMPEPLWEQVFALGHHAAKNLRGSGADNCFEALLNRQDVPLRDADSLPAWQAAALVLLTKTNEWRKPRGIDKKIGFPAGTQERADLQALLASFETQDSILSSLRQLRSLPPASYTEQQKEILRVSFLLLRRAVAHLKVAFAQTGETDFVEIALAANDALSAETNNLADVFGTAIQHLLVDEMQDTSITQFELFSRLVESWDGHSQTVFLVGDPKQSIYRFRNVEVKLFERARREGLGGIHLQPIKLSSNFRSHQSLVSETNAAFTQIFEDGSGSDGVSFTASDATHREPATQRIFWHPALLPRTAATSDLLELRANEARAVCDAIELHRSHVGPGEQPPSIAVLIRARTHAHAILAEMRRRNIPYRAVEMDKLGDRQALLDLLTIARCLLHPADRIAWLAALRAPWCGISLADLLALCGNDESSQNTKTVLELFRERGNQLTPDGQQRAMRTIEILQAALQSSAHERFSLLVERAWRTLGGPECIPAAEVGGVTDFFRMLERIERGGAPTARALQQEMKKLHASPMASGDAPVEVLTLFKAKGLEWDVVLMPGLHRQPAKDDPRLIEWVEQIENPAVAAEEADSILLAPIKHAAEDKESIGQWICSIRAERDRAEQKRLFYVGCTRARQAVHLFGEAALEHTGEVKPPGKNSLLHTAWPVAKEIFSNHAAQSQTSAPAQIIEMPFPDATGPGIVDDLAAAASGLPNNIKLSNFQRVPPSWQPAMPQDLHLFSAAPVEAAEDAVAFQRPQGSWRARVFGTVLHAFLNPLADLLRRENDAATDAAIQSLAQPIALQLRREGFSAAEAESESKRIVKALHQAANDATGRWLLTAPAFLPGHGNGFEVPLTTIQKSGLRSVRIDRMFLAGAAPTEIGDQFLWIVDFKTAACGADRIEQFLREEQALYTPQLEEYASAVRAVYPAHRPMRLGLYYPLLRQFLWWADKPA